MSNNTLTPVGDQSAAASPNPNPAVKRRRNLPGNPAPDAEVIALSPTSLMATNRFVCEVCNKGFQREQNLQLHRRGHNLPWKLNKRTAVVISGSGTNNDEEVEMVVVRKKVYVCPEEGCVHHQASRALGDLTGIKKHFSRKHGEKKFKCEKCSKKYAVHSDWKAHSKTCGTKEYKCDCGTIFSRRDSFVTHRAFCDALAEESSKTITNPNHNINLFTPPQPSPSLNSNSTIPIISHDIHQQLSTKTDQNNFNYMRILQTQPWTNSSLRNNIMLSPLPFSFPSSLLPSSSSSSSSSSSHLSATALLQKAAEVGATMSTGVPSVSQMATHHHSSTSSSSPSLLQEMMMMMSSSTTSSSLSVTPGFSNDNNNNELEVFKIDQGLTRDFLGLNALSHADIFTMARSLHYDQMSSERDEKR